MTPELADHLEQITRELKQGRVIPFLGAGVNLCGFPRNEPHSGICAAFRAATPSCRLSK